MVAKPVLEDIRWATDGTNNSAPSASQRNTGWTPGQDGVSDYDNVCKHEAYKWAAYLDAGILEGPFGLRGVISPAAINTQQDNWNPTGLSGAGVIRVDLGPTNDVTVTGLAGGENGRTLLVVNTDLNFILTLAHESASSTAANRFFCPEGIDLPLGPNVSALLWYDSTLSRWRVVTTCTNHGNRVNIRHWQYMRTGTLPVGELVPANPGTYFDTFNNNAVIACFLDLPVGARLKSVDWRSFGDGTADYTATLYKASYNPNIAPAVIDTEVVTNESAAWADHTLAPPGITADQQLSTGQYFYIRVTFGGIAGTEPRLGPPRITWDKPQ